MGGDSWEKMFMSFRNMVSRAYRDWKWYLLDSLSPADQRYYESISGNEASADRWTDSLLRLCEFLAQKSQRKVMVFVDEYEAPNNHSYQHDFFDTVGLSYPFRLPSKLKTVIQANRFFGREVLHPLLNVGFNSTNIMTEHLTTLIQTNPNLEYAILAGVTPTTKVGWYSGLNNIEVRRFMLACGGTI
jgi:hypothetical protein